VCTTAPAAFAPGLVPDLVGRLAGGQQDQQLPQVVAVGQAREAVLVHAAAKAVEGAEGHVLLVGGGPGPAQQFLAGQSDEPAEVAFPEVLRGVGLAGPELREPDGNGPR
jgi:hypothetical protein